MSEHKKCGKKEHCELFIQLCVSNLPTPNLYDGQVRKIDRETNNLYKIICTVKVHNFLIPGITFLALFRDHSAIFSGIPVDTSNDTFSNGPEKSEALSE